jgi:hypothetical protein
VVWERVAVLAGRKAVRQGKMFAEHVAPAIIKPARALWNQVIGFIFLCLAVPCANKTVRYAMAGDYPRLLIAGIPTILLGWFGLYSFLLARKISRS